MKAFNYLWVFFSLILVIQEVVVLLLQNLLFRLILTFFFWYGTLSRQVLKIRFDILSPVVYFIWLLTWHFEAVTPLWKERGVIQQFLMLQKNIHGMLIEWTINSGKQYQQNQTCFYVCSKMPVVFDLLVNVPSGYCSYLGAVGGMGVYI